MCNLVRGILAVLGGYEIGGWNYPSDLAFVKHKTLGPEEQSYLAHRRNASIA